VGEKHTFLYFFTCTKLCNNSVIFFFCGSDAVLRWIGGSKNILKMPHNQGRNEGGQGGAIPQAPSHFGGVKSLRGTPTSSNNVTSTLFNAVHLLPKNLSFEYVGAKLASCPGRHLTSLRLCA